MRYNFRFSQKEITKNAFSELCYLIYISAKTRQSTRNDENPPAIMPLFVNLVRTDIRGYYRCIEKDKTESLI